MNAKRLIVTLVFAAILIGFFIWIIGVFIDDAARKKRIWREEAQKVNPSLQIEVDGGIKTDNVHVVLEAGANLIVAGSAVYGKDVLGQTRAFMKLLGE